MTRPDGSESGRSGRLFTAIDGWFYGLLAAEVLSMAIFPPLPLLLAVVAFVTPLRRSRWRLAVIVAAGVILGAIVLAPFVIGMDRSDLGPVRVGAP